jgi:hypothetical protein
MSVGWAPGSNNSNNNSSSSSSSNSPEGCPTKADRAEFEMHQIRVPLCGCPTPEEKHMKMSTGCRNLKQSLQAPVRHFDGRQVPHHTAEMPVLRWLSLRCQRKTLHVGMAHWRPMPQ